MPRSVRHGAAEARIDGRFDVAPTTATTRSCSAGSIPAGRPLAGVRRTVARPPSSTLAEITGERHRPPRPARPPEPAVGRRRSALRSTSSAASISARCATARARLTEIDAELATLGRRRTGPGPRDRPAALPGRRARRRRRSSTPTRTTRSTREEATAGRRGRPSRGRRRRRSTVLRGDGGVADAVGAALGRSATRSRSASSIDRLDGSRRRARRRRRRAPRLAESIDENPERLAEIRERRQLLADLRRKYGDDLAEVMRFHAEAEDRLRELEQLRPACGRARRRACGGGRASSERPPSRSAARRREVAPEARGGGRGAVCGSWRCRTRPSAIEVGGDADDHPGDECGSCWPPIPGSPLLPLSRVASGGELARAMLALRLVLSAAPVSVGGAATLVFDEVDAGIGGVGGGGGRDVRWPTSAATIRCWSSPTCPGGRQRDPPARRRQDGARTVPPSPRSTPVDGDDGSPRSPGCSPGRTRRRRSSTPAICSER